MSLINQVLRDLDQRHADAPGRPAAVRPLPAERPTAPWTGRLVPWVLAAGGLAASAWLWSLRERPMPAVVDPPPNPASAPTAVATDVTAPASTPVVIAAAPAASMVASRASDPGPADIAASHAGPAASAIAPQTEAPAVPRPRVPRPAPVPLRDKAQARSTGNIESRAPVRTAHARAEAEYQRALSLREQGRPDDAAAAYASALREEPGFVPARQGLAGLWIAQGRADEAKTLLSAGLALQPSHPGLAMMYARLLAEQGELQHAAAVLQYVPVLGASAQELGWRAAILQRLGRHAEACELFAAALRIVPNNGVWWMGLGLSLAADGRNDEARDAFQRARRSGTLSPELTHYVEQRIRQL